MNSEQFTFWLSGYLSCSTEIETKIYKDISIIIKQVKNDKIQNVIYGTGEMFL